MAVRLASCAEVVWACSSTGSYDVFCWVAVPSTSELRGFLQGRAASIPGVQRMETFVVLSAQKRHGMMVERTPAAAPSWRARRRRTPPQ